LVGGHFLYELLFQPFSRDCPALSIETGTASKEMAHSGVEDLAGAKVVDKTFTNTLVDSNA